MNCTKIVKRISIELHTKCMYFILQGCWLGSYMCSSLPAISEIPGNQKTVPDILDIHQQTIVLSVLITKTILLDQTQLSMADTVSNDVLVKLYLDASWINTWCLCVLGCRSVHDSQVSKDEMHY